MMETVRALVPTSTIEAFAELHGLTMLVSERPGPLVASGLRRFYATFKSTDVMEDGCLIGTHGNGNTEEEAIADYARGISELRIAVRAGDALSRMEIQCPRFETGGR
jgi:hypothetical protein